MRPQGNIPGDGAWPHIRPTFVKATIAFLVLARVVPSAVAAYRQLTMELIELCALFTVIFIPLLLLFLVRCAKPLPIPGPGILEYCPGGVVHPLFKDEKSATKVMNDISLAYGDVFQMRMGPELCVFTAVPEDIVQVISHIKSFGRSPAMLAPFKVLAPGGIFGMVGETRRVVRRKVREKFNYPLLESFQPSMSEAIEELCDSLLVETNATPDGEPSNTIDINPFLTVTTFRVIANVAFGMEMDRDERLRVEKTVKLLVSEMMKDLIGYPFRQALSFTGCRKALFESSADFRSKCRFFIEQRLNESREDAGNRRKDVLDVILGLDNIDPEAVASMVTEFTVAGSHTTHMALTWCIHELCVNPECAIAVEKQVSEYLGTRPWCQPIVLEDIKNLKCVVNIWKESLRLHGFGAGILREARENVVLKGSGVFIPKGTRVMAHTLRASTHEKIWKDPLNFNPDRWGSTGKDAERVPPGAFLPFGVGDYSCIGRFLVDFEGPLILAELIRRFRFSLACKPEEIVLSSDFVDGPRTTNQSSEMKGMRLPVQVRVREIPCRI